MWIIQLQNCFIIFNSVFEESVLVLLQVNRSQKFFNLGELTWQARFCCDRGWLAFFVLQLYGFLQVTLHFRILFVLQRLDPVDEGIVWVFRCVLTNRRLACFLHAIKYRFGITLNRLAGCSTSPNISFCTLAFLLRSFLLLHLNKFLNHLQLFFQLFVLLFKHLWCRRLFRSSLSPGLPRSTTWSSFSVGWRGSYSCCGSLRASNSHINLRLWFWRSCSLFHF